MTDKQRLDVLGSGMEVNEAYRLLLENSKAVRDSSEAIRADIAATAGGGGALSGALATVEGSQRFMAREAVLRAEQSLDIARESRFSGDEAAFQAGLAGGRAQALNSGGGDLASSLGGMAARAVRATAGSKISGGTAAAVGVEIASMSDFELAASASPMGAVIQLMGAITRLGGRAAGSGDPVVEELKGIRANTSPGPVFTGSSLQGPLQSAAQP